jgi:hypothetical protein
MGSQKDSLNYWYEIHCEKRFDQIEKMVDDFFELSNAFVASNQKFSKAEMDVSFLHPIMNQNKYIDATLNPINPVKGAFTAFIVSLILSSLFFACLRDIKSSQQSA